MTYIGIQRNYATNYSNHNTLRTIIHKNTLYRSKGFRIVLTRSRMHMISELRIAQRRAYNWAVEHLKHDTTLTFYDLSKRFRALRKCDCTLNGTPAEYQLTAIRQARTACDVSNRHGNGELRYRSRKRTPHMAVESHYTPKYTDNFFVRLYGLGTVKMYEGQPYKFPKNWLYGARSYSMVDCTPKRCKGRDRVYRLYITYKHDVSARRTGGMSVGIDRGIANPPTVARSDGTITCYDTTLRKFEYTADREKSKISKQNAKSRRHAKRIIRLRQRKIEWQRYRDNAEWELAKEICSNAKVICFEKLYLEAMTHRGRRKSGLNRRMRHVRHGEIRRKVEVLAERLGIRVVDVDPKHTSRECSMCGHMKKENRHGEVFKCLECDCTANADGNAASNILYRGTGIRVPPGEGIALDRRELGRTRNRHPVWVHTDPDAPRRDNQARNRSYKSAEKHLGRYAYITRVLL